MTTNTDTGCTHTLMDVSTTENGKMAGNMDKVSISQPLVSTEWAFGMLGKGKDGLIKYKKRLQNEI